MVIVIKTVPHRAQRYDTCGDWQIDAKGNWHITISELPQKHGPFHDKFAFLVAFHELVEMALCTARGVTPAAVDEFDIGWKPPSAHIQEQGDDPAAPYFREHQIASALERFMAAQLDVDWSEYERSINQLSYGGEPP